MIARRAVASTLVMAALLATGHLAAQAQFDAASVKRNPGNAAGLPPVIVVRSNRLMAPFTTARELVRVAYDVEQMRVIGGPAWIDRDHFAITATIHGEVSEVRAREMLRSLLADRFGLSVHHETRELPAYVLDYARPDHRLGNDIRPAGPTCAPVTVPTGPGVPPPPPPPPAGSGPPPILLSRAIAVPCPSFFAPGFFSGRRIPMTLLVSQLRDAVQRPVVDRTGLDAAFDIDLTYATDVALPRGAIAPADAPSIFTAVQDQLGLKLESRREPLDVVVIDRIQPPTEN